MTYVLWPFGETRTPKPVRVSSQRNASRPALGRASTDRFVMRLIGKGSPSSAYPRNHHGITEAQYTDIPRDVIIFLSYEVPTTCAICTFGDISCSPTVNQE